MSVGLGRSGCVSLGHCASCSGVGILLGRSCHVSPSVPVWPGDELTAHHWGRFSGPWELGQAAQPLWVILATRGEPTSSQDSMGMCPRTL